MRSLCEVHQGLALSLQLFSLVMNEITKDIQGELLWCMLFTDYIGVGNRMLGNKQENRIENNYNYL